MEFWAPFRQRSGKTADACVCSRGRQRPRRRPRRRPEMPDSIVCRGTTALTARLNVFDRSATVAAAAAAAAQVPPRRQTHAAAPRARRRAAPAFAAMPRTCSSDQLATRPRMSRGLDSRVKRTGWRASTAVRIMRPRCELASAKRTPAQHACGEKLQPQLRQFVQRLGASWAATPHASPQGAAAAAGIAGGIGPRDVLLGPQIAQPGTAACAR